MATENPRRTQVAITAPTIVETRKSWLRYEHPEYEANKGRWQYARDHYTGDVLEDTKIKKYLIKRVTGETEQAYEERCKLADYTNHFAEATESLAGMLAAVEDDANRRFVDENGNGLGVVDDPSTPIGRLWASGYLTRFKQLAIELVHSHSAWVFVDPADGESRVCVLPALSVPNWAPDYSEALIIEEADTRKSLMDAPAGEIRFLHITARGWQRYTEDKNGNPVRLTGPGDTGIWAFQTQAGKPRIPLYHVTVPMKRPIGYQQARKANVIFNKESVRDFGQRVAGFQKLVLAAGDDLYAKLENAIVDGANLLQEDPLNSGGGHRYIGPDPAPATALTETIKQNVVDFKSTFHKAYDDSAAEKTATEVRQDVGAGTGAFLQLLKAALDDAENAALQLLEQSEFPGQPSRWFIARVERSSDFVPVDLDLVYEKSAKAAFGEGKPVPMGVSARIALAKEIAENRGAQIDPDELSAHVRVATMIELLESAPTSGLELPAEVKGELVMLAIAAAGLIPKDATEQMEDGTKKSKLELVRTKVMQTLQAAEEAKQREAELLAGGGGGQGDFGGGDE